MLREKVLVNRPYRAYLALALVPKNDAIEERKCERPGGVCALLRPQLREENMFERDGDC